MSDEQQNNGGTTATLVNPAATAAAPKQAPVMDVVPPPAMSSGPGEAPVVAAPPEEVAYIPVSDDIAEQIAADSTVPPPLEPSTVESDTGPHGMASPPQESEPKAADAGDSPSELIEAEIQREEALPVQEAQKAPKVHNPARSAVIATVFITIILAGLAVFAYLSTQN